MAPTRVDAASGPPYAIWDSWRHDPGPAGAVAAAVLAGTPQDAQLWRFRVTSERIDLFSDASRLITELDPLLREHDIGLGGALENLLQATAARGYAAEVALLPDPADQTHVARIWLHAGCASPSPLYEQIGPSYADRGPCTDQPVSPAALDVLATYGGILPGVKLHWFTSPDDRATISSLLVDATPPGTIRPPQAVVYGLISVSDPSVAFQRLLGGRLLQRMRLAATKSDLGLHPLGQVTHRIDQDVAHRRPSSLGRQVDALIDHPDQHVLVMFTVGHPRRAGWRIAQEPLSGVAA